MKNNKGIATILILVMIGVSIFFLLLISVFITSGTEEEEDCTEAEVTTDYIPPLDDYTVTSLYGYRDCSNCSKFHLAVDMTSPKSGAKIKAAQSGTVVQAGGDSLNIIKIKHSNGEYTRYLHNSKVLVKKGQKVNQGDAIGIIGGAGGYAVHCHFEILDKNGKAQSKVNEMFGYKSTKKCTVKVAEHHSGCGCPSSNCKSDQKARLLNKSGKYEGKIASVKSTSYTCNGVVLSGSKKTIDLEEYVAGVVSAENNLHDGKNIENMKAQAIAARTYVLSRTNNCKKSISNSSAAQNYTKANETAKKAAQETAGMVLTFKGKIFSSEYDSFYKSGDFSCNSTTCSVSYRRIPSKKTHKVSVPSSWKGRLGGGHGRGMSQFGSYYLSKQGKTYDEILKYFYADGVQLSAPNGTSQVTCKKKEDDFSVSSTSWVENAMQMANNNKIGYSQTTRYLNPNVDCSSFVYYSLKQAGFKVSKIGHSPFVANLESEGSALKKAGFKQMSYSKDKLQPGDILLRNHHHTEIYIGKGKTVGAHSNYDGSSGDSSGKEVSVVSNSNNWTHIFRYSN